MATQIKKNEAVVLGTHKNGVHLQFVTITFQSSVAAALGATAAGVQSPVVQALEAIATVASIEIIGVGNGTTTVNIAVAASGGDFVPASGTFALQLQGLVRAAGVITGALQGIDNNATNVTALVF